MSTTSLLQTALQNLHVSQQARESGMSMTPRSISTPGTPRSPSGRASPALPQPHTHTHKDAVSALRLDAGVRMGRSPSAPGSTRSGSGGGGGEGGSPPSTTGASDGSAGERGWVGDGDGDGDDGESESESEEEGRVMVAVGEGTRPGTPIPGKGMVLGQRPKREKSKDPLRTLPTHLAVRVYLQLDVRSLARCSRVCKRWNKSSTLNYVWFLQNRALLLPLPLLPGTLGRVRKTGNDTPDFFDPYDKSPRLASLPPPPLPTSAQPQWSKAESKRQWKAAFRATLRRSDPNAEEEIDPRRVDINSLHSSGVSTPSGVHAHAGAGSGGAAKWAAGGEGGMTPTERKVAAREGYRALGGRKARGKRRMGGELGVKDKGGAEDGRFDAPW